STPTFITRLFGAPKNKAVGSTTPQYQRLGKVHQCSQKSVNFVSTFRSSRIAQNGTQRKQPTSAWKTPTTRKHYPAPGYTTSYSETPPVRPRSTTYSRSKQREHYIH